MSGKLRETLLTVMNEYAGQPGFFQTKPILHEVARREGLRGDAQEQALLTLWGDMFRLGIVATGYNLSNTDAPFCHLTELGRKTLKSISRDPANPDGYIAAVKAAAKLPPTAESYVEEAVATYNTACFKAAAVMIGAASETLLLALRHAIVARLGTLGRKVPAVLADWRAKTVLDAISTELTAHAKSMPVKLRESFQYNWPAFLQQIRASRNDAGHPASIELVTGEVVHASLLIFPELAKLSTELQAWVVNAMP
ncbi:MAG: hypothetical protein ACLQVI_23440 [Polyangiaceae bacterium]